MKGGTDLARLIGKVGKPPMKEEKAPASPGVYLRREAVTQVRRGIWGHTDSMHVKTTPNPLPR